MTNLRNIRTYQSSSSEEANDTVGLTLLTVKSQPEICENQIDEGKRLNDFLQSLLLFGDWWQRFALIPTTLNASFSSKGQHGEIQKDNDIVIIPVGLSCFQPNWDRQTFAPWTLSWLNGWSTEVLTPLGYQAGRKLHDTKAPIRRLQKPFTKAPHFTTDWKADEQSWNRPQWSRD